MCVHKHNFNFAFSRLTSQPFIRMCVYSISGNYNAIVDGVTKLLKQFLYNKNLTQKYPLKHMMRMMQVYIHLEESIFLDMDTFALILMSLIIRICSAFNFTLKSIHFLKNPSYFISFLRKTVTNHKISSECFAYVLHIFSSFDFLIFLSLSK